MNGSPLVSLGMPVFNGEAFIADAIDPLLAQTYENFEIVISDNASTDGTEMICRAYADKDARIRYVRSRSNYGYVHNFNNVFRLSRGRYFKWAASDDVCRPDFLRRCVAVLEDDPSSVLAYTGITGIDATGAEVALPEHYHRRGDQGGRDAMLSDDPLARFRRLIRDPWWVASCFFGLMRAETLERTALHGSFHGGDQVLLTELSLHGRFFEVEEPLFMIRIHSEKLSRKKTLRDRLSTVQLWPEDKKLRWWDVLRGHHWRRIQGYLTAIRRGPIPATRRPLFYLEVARAMWWWVRVRGIPALAHKLKVREAD